LPKTFTVEMDGRSYVWNGRSWFAAKTYQAPPLALASKLNELLASVLAVEDAEVKDFHELLKIAQAARNASQFKRAEMAARRAIELQPSSQPAFAVLCSVLRRLGAPERAVQETDHLRSMNYPPLLISRAAALCDLERWEEAKTTLGRALAAGGSPEAFEVVHRIKANRPDLYEDPKGRP
jgi:tetratricopeptide (TPR) repeat protein